MSVPKIYKDNHLAIQQGQSNCGPTALLNIFHLKGIFSHTEDELAEICESKLGYGTTPDNLIAAIKQLGLQLVETKSYGTIDDIQRNINNGAYVIILFTNGFSGNTHYTVVTEYDTEALYCRDSWFGLFRFSKEYLVNSWQGNGKDASGDTKQWYVALK